MLSIIDRYIAKQFMGYFLAGLLVFVSIFLAADFTSTMVRFDASLSVVGRYYLYYLPNVIYQMIPVGCLVAAMFTLSNLNKTNELVSLYSMGLSLARISSPILVLVGVISVVTFWLGDRVLPSTMQTRRYIYYVEIKNRPHLYSTVKQDKIWYRSQNVIFNIRVFNPEAARAEGLTMYYFDESWNLVQLIRARMVSLKSKTWEMKDGTVTLFTEESSFPMSRSFKDKTISMTDDLTDISLSRPSNQSLSIKDLNRYIEKNKSLGLDTTSFEVDYHGKLAFAFTGFVLVLLGIPFTTKHQRSGGAMVNIGICAGLALVYWILFSAGLSLGKHGSLPPILAAWLANALSVAAAAYMIKQKTQA